MIDFNALQKAVYQALIADAALMALVTGVYDAAPDDANMPYIAFGPGDVQPERYAGVESWEEALQIDIWSDYGGGFKESKDIAAAVMNVLDEAVINSPTVRIVSITIESARHFRDANPKISHGVLTIEAVLENG